MSKRIVSYNGGLKELVLLFLPIVAITFSNLAFVLVEKLFLAKLSENDLKAAVNAAYAWQIFQGSTVALALMAQVYVGRYFGANDFKSIGPVVWQFIWFSLFSSVLTIPIGILYGNFYFHNTGLESNAIPYYTYLLCLNFLFPLAASLISFYIGRGKMKLVFLATVATQITKIYLAYILILGVDGYFQPLGLLGGVISTFISQAGLCLILFIVFLNSENRTLFDTSKWGFNFKLFYTSINPGLMRAICRILTFLSWASIARMMMTRGEDYLLILSLGGTIFLFLPFVSDAIFQAQTTAAANILGSGNLELLRKSFKSGALLVIILSLLFAIPFILFPVKIFFTLFPELYLEDGVIVRVFFGVWLSFVFFTFVFIPISHVLVLGDAPFTLFMGFFNWVNGYAFMYMAIEWFKISAENFWIALSFMHITTAIIYSLRVRSITNKLSLKQACSY